MRCASVSLYCTAALLMFLSTAARSEEVTLYVAPDGDASAAGTKADPFGSLEQAAASAAKRADESPVRVLVRGGAYRLAEPIELRPEHFGTADHPTQLNAGFDRTPAQLQVEGRGQGAQWVKGLLDVMGLHATPPFQRIQLSRETD